MSRAILYCSPNVSVVLLDLPTSIAEAQISDRQLLSTTPISEPYLSAEPVGKKRDKLLALVPAAQRRHDAVVRSSLLRGLSEVRQHMADSPWCLDRVSPEHESTQFAAGIYGSCVGEYQRLIHSPPLVLAPGSNCVHSLDYLHYHIVINPAHSGSVLRIGSHGSFDVPPKSILLNATIQQGLPRLETALRCLGLERTSDHVRNVPAFHLMLLDPPWTNRSVRHSRVYRSKEFQQGDPFLETLPIIRHHLRDDGIVAIWITNKAAIRNQVVEELSKLTFKLVEEWTWLKVTSHGEPVSPVDGLWRKPYETLLLFTRMPAVSEIKLRTIVAVPDIHSRKPNLKCILETLMPPEYQALELFARSLTAGWWSWGDEVLKFQHHSHWTRLTYES